MITVTENEKQLPPKPHILSVKSVSTNTKFKAAPHPLPIIVLYSKIYNRQQVQIHILKETGHLCLTVKHSIEGLRKFFPGSFRHLDLEDGCA